MPFQEDPLHAIRLPYVRKYVKNVAGRPDLANSQLPICGSPVDIPGHFGLCVREEVGCFEWTDSMDENISHNLLCDALETRRLQGSSFSDVGASWELVKTCEKTLNTRQHTNLFDVRRFSTCVWPSN